MRHEPQPSVLDITTTSWCFRPSRINPPKITAQMLAEAILSHQAPCGAPFHEWVPRLFEGWVHEPLTLEDQLRDFGVWLRSDQPKTVQGAIGILSDVAHDLYGGDDE